MWIYRLHTPRVNVALALLAITMALLAAGCAQKAPIAPRAQPSPPIAHKPPTTNHQPPTTPPSTIQPSARTAEPTQQPESPHPEVARERRPLSMPSPPPPAAHQPISETGAGAAPPPPPTQKGTVAFNAPRTMQYDTPETIELLLASDMSKEGLRALLKRDWDVEADTIRITNRMQAKLWGKGFDIEALAPEMQGVESDTPTRWEWEVTPTRTGKRTLHLSLSAIITQSDKDAPKLINTFHKTIVVKITSVQRASLFVKSNWQWLWATVLVPVVGIIGRRYFRKRKAGRFLGDDIPGPGESAHVQINQDNEDLGV